MLQPVNGWTIFKERIVMNNEALFIASEINELESLLASIPAADVIERMSLEARLSKAKAELATLPQRPVPKARLTFRGAPVFGSRAIAVDFGGKAINAFSDAFATIAAASNEGLRDMGPIPDRNKNRLLLTGTAIGSFGFEFELPAEESSLLPENTTTALETMKKIESLFRLAAEGSDDEIAEIIEEVHPRAVKKIHEFLDLLVQQQAWCALEFADRSFRYASYDQIKNSCERLKDDNIQEREETYQGEFQGILPASRTFEFKLTNQEGLLKGKINKAIDDPDVLNREWLYKPATVKFSLMQVGQGQRYTLMSLNDLK
jgi:hypothetical protein